jgi:hypothetical protein
MIRVKNCCHSPNKPDRFDAVVGDHVLVRRDAEVYFGGVIHSVPSAGSVTLTLHDGNQITVDTAAITALLVDD